MQKSPYDEGWLEGLAVELQLNHPQAASLVHDAKPRQKTNGQDDGGDNERDVVTAKFERPHER